ncbi:sugar transferase [Rubinisphaera sp. JC750]|uniref:sugar transferase n=1 Tax=Rubinisphaera sp. JC750 TaxID=2898658 RepID=UPI0028F43F9D|nr:sugar transferase [Rubinisphaera sp. JC750]
MSTATYPANAAPTYSAPKVPTQNAPLADVVDFAASGVRTPAQEKQVAEWMSRLKGQPPRQNVHCLSWRVRLGKRILDVIFASVLLVLLAPVMLLTAIAVKLTSPGPVIFRQTRVGLNLRKDRNDRRRNDYGPPEDLGERRQPGQDRRLETRYGREFTLYKFRTMRNDAEKNGAQFAVKGDPRVTSIGRFMRKTRLDELPQLWNVLRGEMSMVGPRPERPVFIEKLSEEIPDYVQRLGLKPGLTGLAQIENGYDNDIDSFRRKVTYDLIYLQHCCLWNDLKILFRTIRVVLTGSGAL